MDTQKMAIGYHKDFAIFYSEGQELRKLQLNDWVTMVETYKQSGDRSGQRNFEYEIVQIDIVETAAYVKLKLVRKGILVFTDLITMLKFDDQWKIVTKVYHTHVANAWG